LTRAAKDFLDSDPAFALGAALTSLHWLFEGWGYEITSLDVIETYDLVLAAAAKRGTVDTVADQIRCLVESKEIRDGTFIRCALSGRLRVN